MSFDIYKNKKKILTQSTKLTVKAKVLLLLPRCNNILLMYKYC